MNIKFYFARIDFYVMLIILNLTRLNNLFACIFLQMLDTFD